MKKKPKSHPSNVVRLQPFNEDKLVRVVVETPKGSRNKYALEPKDGVYQLSRVLPEGMSFPFDFGFIPRTLADDGDPIDVLIFMDEPTFPGCVVECRLIGVIRGEQEENGKRDRNDRILAVPGAAETSFSYLKTVRDLPKQLLRDLTGFFENYHRLQGRRYRVLDTEGPEAARKLILRGMKAA